MAKTVRFQGRVDFLESSLSRTANLSNVTKNVLGAICFLRFENLSHVLEDGSGLRDVFGQVKDLLVGMDHNIGRLVKSRRHGCTNGSNAEDAADETNLGHFTY